MRSVGFNPDDTLPKTFDLQRVEVLRGPQGTLFGAGAEGGAVRYILTQPSVTRADTYVRSEVSYTQYGQPSVEFGIARGQPLVDGTFGVRASIWYRYDGGWIDRVDPTTAAVVNHNINYSNSIMARLAAAWQPTAASPSLRACSTRDRTSTTSRLTGRRIPIWTRAVQHGDARAHRRAGRLLPASAKDPVGPGQEPDYLEHGLFYRKQLTAYQGTVYDLSYWQSSVGGCTSNQDPGCPWYPLI